MFKKTHLRLAVFNTIILVLFLMIFSSGIHTYMTRAMNKSIEIILNDAANSVKNLNEIPILKKPPVQDFSRFKFGKTNRISRRDIKINFVLWDENINVNISTDESNENTEYLQKLAEKTLENNEKIVVNTEINNERVRLLSVPFNNGNEIGVVQVYQSVEVERMFSSQLILTLIIIGLISIVILAIISYVLAGISLIPIKKSWNQQKDFVADASHELRTPLTVIQTNLDVALSDEEGTIEENHEWINNAYTESIKMSKLVNDLLLLAKIDSKEIYIKKESIDITELLKQVISHMRPMFNNKKIKLEENILDNILVYGDYDRIRQLIIILLDNAIKYTNDNGSVEITLENIENKTLLKVKDTGIGLSEEDKEKVFNRFYRSDKARTSENGGSGLGLSIAYWIVKSHNGTIKLESELSKGSAFIVELPKI